MNAAATLASILILVLLVGAGVSFYVYRSAEAESVAIGRSDTGALQDRIVELESEVDRLRDELRKSENAPVRQAVQPVTDARIEAAVAKWMAQNRVAASAGKPNAQRDLGQTFLHLTSDLSEQDYMDVWKQLREEGRVEEMVAMFEKHAANNPNNAEIQFQLGAAYLMQIQGAPPSPETGRVAANADKTFDRALEIDPDHWEARFVKAQALSFWPPMFGKQAEAIQHLEKLRGQQEANATQDAKYAQTYTVLGNLYSQQGKKDKAMEVWRKGAALFPDDATLRDKIEQK